MKNYCYLLPLFFLLTAFSNLSHARTISGQVTDATTNQPLPGVAVQAKGTSISTVTNTLGNFKFEVPNTAQTLTFSFIGYATQEVQMNASGIIKVALKPDNHALQEVVVTGYSSIQSLAGKVAGVVSGVKIRGNDSRETRMSAPMDYYPRAHFNTEEYDRIEDNNFLAAKRHPLSTFSIDVDAASYSNLRRFLNNGQKPPKDAVRIEEMVNYFKYNYPQPKTEDPFAVITELTACPWNQDNLLLHIALQGKNIATDNLPPANLVFLVDVSGSMDSPDKLPLVIAGFKLLVNQLRPQDKVAITVYAGSAGLVLPPTAGNQKEVTLAALDKLQAGGSTAGGEGIRLAYNVAQEHFLKNGINRVILATDGDFNVGVSSTSELERLIEEKRESGVFLTVLGFGTGSIKDSRMENLADKGNGNYAYVDNIQEAKKVFVNEFGGTLFTIAKDVKLQLEFNPTHVKAYRLIGYENRQLADEDFKNDKKDAGDLGAGHTVTALYEIAPANSKKNVPEADALKYQQPVKNTDKNAYAGELLTLKLRYKTPADNTSKLLEHVVAPTPTSNPSESLRFAAAVAEFGMLLRDSEHRGQATYTGVLDLAEKAKGTDTEGYRAEFVRLVKTTQLLDSPVTEVKGKSLKD